GVCSDGFITTVLPIRNDGANCHTEIIIGQFHGPMAPTTPMGTYDRMALPESSSTSTSSSRTKSALARNQDSQAPASKRALGPLSGVPASRASTSAKASTEALTASAALCK